MCSDQYDLELVVDTLCMIQSLVAFNTVDRVIGSRVVAVINTLVTGPGGPERVGRSVGR